MSVLGQWLTPWDFSLVLLLAVAALALWYWRRRAARSPIAQASFWLGLIALYAVQNTGFDYYAQHEFFMHRLQHLVLHHLAPFLLALGWPANDRQAHGLTSHPLNAGWSVGRMLTHPIVSAFLFNALVLLWLIPAVHFPAMLDWRWYRAMNWSVLVSGLLFWLMALRGIAPGWPAVAGGMRIGLMIAVIPLQIVLGALIFFSPAELYPLYTLCGRAFADVDALQDQQIGGLILWIPGAMMSVLGIILVLQQRLRRAPHVPI